MRFHQPLDTILNSAAKVRILRFLCRRGGEWNGRRIALQLGMNPVTAHKALRELHQETLLEFRRVGSNFVYSLRDAHYLIQQALRPLFRQEGAAAERAFDRLRMALPAGLKRQVVAVAVYGSVARRQERPTSDIDLVILVKSEQAKRRVMDALARFSAAVENEFGNTPATYVNTLREARRKFRRLPLFQNILKSHRLIFGQPLENLLHGRAT
ncbi:MAG: nucleotidyltransferase domain-containing protein [Candidatus Omnitrophica bacterium]|nr:nucleotidyltransferase domain-containing protein [Candidatus Omnitrophota bacterium]